jgi:hypothetical protein
MPPIMPPMARKGVKSLPVYHEPGVADGVDFVPASNVVAESSGTAPQALDVLIPDPWVRDLEDKIQAGQAFGFGVRNKKAILQEPSDTAVDILNSSPRVTQKETYPIQPLPKQIDTRIMVGRDHVNCNAMMKVKAQKAGFRHNCKPSMPARNGHTYTE